MMTIRRRIETLEKRTGARRRVTIEDIVAASWGNNPEAERRLAQADPDDPLLRLIAESGSGTDESYGY